MRDLSENAKTLYRYLETFKKRMTSYEIKIFLSVIRQLNRGKDISRKQLSLLKAITLNIRDRGKSRGQLLAEIKDLAE